MREILFRAWVLGKMYDVEALDFNEHGVTIITSGGFHTIEEGSQDDVSHLMQFTGLRDKNGVKIFEGDILSDGESCTKVYWYNSEAEFSNGVASWSELLPSLQIVGNIHE